MAVEDVQLLIDLLADSPEVTELTVKGASGTTVTIKRHPSPTTALSFPSYSESTENELEAQNLLLPEPPIPLKSINASLVGLFHDANPPLITGASVVVGQIVGYIESMRLMNEVVSTVEGRVEAVVTSEGQPVEYGQRLFSIVSFETH